MLITYNIAAHSSNTDCETSNQLFFCNAHNFSGESLALYVRAYNPLDAAERMTSYWKREEVIDHPDDIHENDIVVYEIPSTAGDIGVLAWDDIDCTNVPKDRVF